MVDLRRSFIVAAVGFVVVVVLSQLSYTTAQPHYSDWSTPVNLGPVINTVDTESGPSLSKNGLSLYFSSNRVGSVPPTTGSVLLADIWVSQRSSVDEPWGTPINVYVLNTSAEDALPSLSRDGHRLFWMSRRTDITPFGGFDIYMSYREHIHDDLDWQPPVNVGANVNGSAFDQNPFFFENEDAGAPQLFFTRTTATGNKIFVSNLLADGTFGPAFVVPELDYAANQRGVSVRFDGLEIFFMSNRTPPNVGLQDLWTATRKDVSDPWSGLTNLGNIVNSAVGDFDPFIASDRETLYFASNRAGGVGLLDLYVTTRTKEKHNGK